MGRIFSAVGEYQAGGISSRQMAIWIGYADPNGGGALGGVFYGLGSPLLNLAPGRAAYPMGI